MPITWDQLSGILDRVLIALFTYFVAQGYVSQQEVAGDIATIIGIAGALWGWYVNRPKSILKSAAAIPEVQKVVLNNQALADSIPSDKVDTK